MDKYQDNTLKQPSIPAEILRAAAGHMLDRARTYDQPQGERSMAKTVSAFNALTGHNLSEEQGWLFMGVLKMARTQQGGFRADNYEDLAAYAALQGECAMLTRDRNDKSLLAAEAQLRAR